MANMTGVQVFARADEWPVLASHKESLPTASVSSVFGNHAVKQEWPQCLPHCGVWGDLVEMGWREDSSGEC